MKFTSQEEYGLRCLLRLGTQRQKFGSTPEGSLTIAEISRQEGISPAYVAKLMRVLRTGGLVSSARGAAGGYLLARDPARISVGEAMAVLGGRLYEPRFCAEHAGSAAGPTRPLGGALSAAGRALPGIEARPPGARRERPGPKVARHPAGPAAGPEDEPVCTHSVDCSLRSLWRSLQLVLDQVLDKTSLSDLLCNETEMTSWVGHLVAASGLTPAALSPAAAKN